MTVNNDLFMFLFELLFYACYFCQFIYFSSTFLLEHYKGGGNSDERPLCSFLNIIRGDSDERPLCSFLNIIRGGILMNAPSAPS